jgi:hypothetical protein
MLRKTTRLEAVATIGIDIGKNTYHLIRSSFRSQQACGRTRNCQVKADLVSKIGRPGSQASPGRASGPGPLDSPQPQRQFGATL